MWYTGAYSAWRRFRDLLRGKDVQELKELQRQGMSIQAISKLTGWDRKTIRKYMQAAGVAPEYGPRSPQPSKLDAFKPYLEERLRAGVWNARVLLRELRERNYAGSYTILTDWLRPQRSAARVVAVRRFETAPGKQAQVDWGHLGTLEMAGQQQKLHGFTFTLGYSRRMVAEAARSAMDLQIQKARASQHYMGWREGKHLGSFQSQEKCFFLTLPFIERRNRL